MTEIEEFKKEFSERVIIEWGNNAVTWHQWLKQGDEDKDVIAIEKIGVEWKYPSYEEVVLSTGRLYVGSAIKKGMVSGDVGKGMLKPTAHVTINSLRNWLIKTLIIPERTSNGYSPDLPSKNNG